MNNYFDEEIKNLEREILFLKTCGQKSGAELKLVTKSQNISVPLQLNSSQTRCTGKKAFLLKSDEEKITMVVLDWYIDDIYKRHIYVSDGGVRQASVQLGIYGDDEVAVVVVEGGKDDVDTLKGGSSITVNLKLIVTATNNFTIEAL